jgi:hypothetical protein
LTDAELGLVVSEGSNVFTFISDPFEDSDVDESSEEDKEEDDVDDESSLSFLSSLDSLLAELSSEVFLVINGALFFYNHRSTPSSLKLFAP